MTDPFERLPGIDDEPSGVFYPHPVGSEREIETELERLLAECRERGGHHLASRDDPTEGLVIACTHCYRFWRITTE